VTRAALAGEDRPAWACAGVTSGGDLAVLVHGVAAAKISVDGSGAAILTSSGSLQPVSRLLAGGTIIVSLTLSGPTAMDARLRLDGGIVRGGGVVVTTTTTASAPPAGITAISIQPAGTADPARPLTLVIGARTPSDGSGTGEDEPVPPESDAAAGVHGPASVLVDGVLCSRQHFNDPNRRYCRLCGITIEQLAGNLQRRPRPQLGTLLLDDGTSFALDADYVLGREPMLDADVAAGRARALRISDPDGTVSRLHLRVRLVGWQVEVSDLGSANGSVLHPVAGPQTRLKPRDPVIIEPGTRVTVGHRSIQYLSDRSG
jgi:hypothetical protein